MNNNRMTNDEIMDYLDGTCGAQAKARFDAHLAENADDAEMVAELRFALDAAKEWHQSEPMQVSENFWPQLRDNLGPAPKRSAWSQLRNQFAGAFGPSRAAKLSFGAAFAVIAIAASALLFAPKNATPPVFAGEMSAADRAFVLQSVQKHEAYLQTQPAPGDVSSLETGEDDDNEPAIP